MFVRRPCLPLLALLASACSSDAPVPRVDDGYLTPAQAERIVERWSDDVRDQLLEHVYSEQANRYVRACGKDPLRALPAARLSGEGFQLSGHHANDLSCALAEAGVYLIAERGDGASPTTLVTVADGTGVLEIEVQRTADGVVQQVYSLYAPEVGRLLLRPGPVDVPVTIIAGDVTEQPVTAAESLDAIRALLGRSEFDLSALGIAPTVNERERAPVVREARAPSSP